uniref:DNAJ protein n=1 Tax=Solanum tuberosum TaxID=4113 RepID=M1CKQ1_SOLTU
MSTPLVVGTTIGAAALGARYLIRAWQTFKAAPRVRMFYPGGFDRDMTRREAALILGVRCDDLTLF